MREPRNPFRLRASEHIESEETYIRLFSPDVLDILKNDEIWDKPQIIRSAPGGGKTSLLRLFTPSALLTVYSLRTRDYSKDLFKCLKEIGAISEDGPQVLGIFLRASQSFATLDDLKIETNMKQRLFMSLLNARIVLVALQSALSLCRLLYPQDLHAIEIHPSDPNIQGFYPTLPCNGKILHEWALSLEKTVCDALDSFEPLKETSLPGHDSLISLKLLTSNSLRYNDKPIACRVLLALDDIHRLAFNQRSFILNEIISTRYPISIWMAERLEALEIDELLSSGSTQGRDYGRIITIEDHWRGGAGKSFEKVVSNAADRRARDSKDVELGSFADCLQDSLDGTDWNHRFRDGAEVIAQRLEENAKSTDKYNEWISELKKFEGSSREKAIAWRTLEILIKRDQLKAQQSLFEFPLTKEELNERNSPGIKAAAEFFFCMEFKIPYYYSLSRLASMASSNIEQFLWLGGELFEESVSAILLKHQGQLNPTDQEKIMKKTIKQKWKELPQQVKHGTEVCKFLEAAAKFASWETEKKNAPYAPGVTGIAISMKDRGTLKDKKVLSKDQGLKRLSQVLTSCISQNLFEVKLYHKNKGQYWMLLYFNRMLCVHFGLPLGYGGWRPKSLKELSRWLYRGYSPPMTNSKLNL